MPQGKDFEVTLLLQRIARRESVIVAPKTVVVPRELVALFDLERGTTKEGYNRRGLITYLIDKDSIRASYQCLVTDDMLRIIFSGEHQQRDVVLDIYNGEFKLSVKGEFDQENIPACDPPVRVLASASDPMFVVHKDKRQLTAQTVRLVRKGPDQEYPIYIRPISNTEIKTQTIPDWSIRDVKAFSPQAMRMIMDQIDPRVGENIGFLGDNEFQQHPNLRPAIEIVQLIGQHLN